MNILPKKRWHVRSKDNIARVRKDESKAAIEEKEKQARIKIAEREARTDLLRQRVRERISSSLSNSTSSKKDEKPAKNSHINFFESAEDEAGTKSINQDHEKEAKEEREKYEKQIGYLTYLGQDTNEALGKQSWYNEVPIRFTNEKCEVNVKSKINEDPLNIMRKYMSSVEEEKSKKGEQAHKDVVSIMNTHKHKGKKKSSKDPHKKKDKEKQKKKKRKFSANDLDDKKIKLEKEKKLKILRMKRLKREKEERRRSQNLLIEVRAPAEKELVAKVINKKYNNQFNPEIAKQNYTQ